ncbi:MAG: (2Fe-2S)-binding protein [Dehalococcoidia bacterium]|nr:(2Fe-2S)-binding protein [Dehalococcoidia bacterium]
MNAFICHCFEYTESDIRDEVLQNNGRSLLLERIVEARKAGTCDCDTKNPRGT